MTKRIAASKRSATTQERPLGLVRVLCGNWRHAACKGREPNRSNRLTRESSVICPDLVKRQFQR